MHEMVRMTNISIVRSKFNKTLHLVLIICLKN